MSLRALSVLLVLVWGTSAHAQSKIIGGGVYNSAGGAALGLQTNLSAFWAFASQPSVDSTANGNNLSTGAGTPGTTTGPGANSAVSYNGSNDNTIANNTSLQLGATFSINYWVKSGSASEGIHLSKDDGGFGNWGWYFGTNFTSTNVYSWVFFSVSTNTKTCNSLVSLDATAYHMITGTWDGTNQKIYIDGTLSATCAQTATITADTSAIFVGKDGGAATGAFTTGSIALVALYKNRVLNSTDVTNLYNAGSGLSYAGML